MRRIRHGIPSLWLVACMACAPLPIDPDGDGYVGEDDCRPHYAAVHSGAADPFGDGIDQDCDGQDGNIEQMDADGDGQRSDAYGGQDCDDQDTAVYAGAEEECGDGKVNDCDRSAVSASLDCRMEGDLAEVARATTIVGQPDFELGGRRVASAGDVDGDGHDDVLIGAPGWADNEDRPGAVYVIAAPQGETVSMEEEEVVLKGDREGDCAGFGLSGMGDLNDDDYDDFAVGAPYAQGDDGGAVYFLAGPVALDDANTPGSLSELDEWTVTGPAGLGLDVALMGDVDGDGQDDVALGAPEAYSGRGAVYVVRADAGSDVDLSNPGQDTMELVGLDGSANGWSVCGADFDGDGLGEVVSGAWRYALTAGDSTYKGSVSGMAVSPWTWSVSAADFTLLGERSYDNLGWSVACGDLTGDGHADLLAGAPGMDAGADRPGSVYLVGGATLAASPGAVDVSAVALAVLPGAQDGESFGAAVAIPGDIDGDGLSDVLVGAPALAVEAGAPGSAYLFYASGGLEGVIAARGAAATLAGERAGVATGMSASGAGDVDGDGWPDLLVGAPLEEQDEFQMGQVWLVYGGGY